MAETNQIRFSLREAALALLRKNGIEKGKWMIGVNFELAAGNMGPTPAEARPSALLRITDVLLTRTNETEPSALVVDAAEAKETAQPPSKRRSKEKA